MQSMTGYSFIERSMKQFSFSVELKSFNSRYLEIFINLPRILRNEENKFNNILKKWFTRGKLELTIDIFDWVETKPVSLNKNLIKKYFRELKKIHKELMVKEPLKFESILVLDGIIQRDRTVIADRSIKDIYQALELVIKKTIEMRKKEGSAIKADLTNYNVQIAKDVEKIKGLSKNVGKVKMELLKKRIDSLSRSNINNDRAYIEIAILADKLDINEEIVRLKDHLRKFKSILSDKDQIGRKIDFISQEMFREINTIASKSNNSEISHLVVDVKNCIEKVREHSRNIV